MCRKPCKECPWVTKSKHSEKWPSYVDTVVKAGLLEDRKHVCHMISKETWSKPTSDNVCIGSIINN